MNINIDVFPIDNVPENVDEWKKYDQYRRKCFDLYSRVVDTPPIFNFNNGKPFLRNVISTLIKPFFHLVSNHMMAKWFQKVATKYNKTNSPMVFECAQGIFQKRPFPKALFDNRIMMPFEDREYMCFADYDLYLTNGFGNWHQLPPKEKQVTHHNFKAWWKD